MSSQNPYYPWLPGSGGCRTNPLAPMGRDMTGTPEQQIARGLRKIRTLRKLLFGVVITFPIVVYLLTMLEVEEGIIIMTGIAWVAVGIVLEFVIGFARCPACRKHFHVRAMSGNFFTKKCMNCGIPLK